MKMCTCVILIVGAVVAIAGAILVGITPAAVDAGARSFSLRPLGTMLVDLGLIATVLSGAALAGMAIVEGVKKAKA